MSFVIIVEHLSLNVHLLQQGAIRAEQGTGNTSVAGDAALADLVVKEVVRTERLGTNVLH